jgi:hypothetical protein
MCPHQQRLSPPPIQNAGRDKKFQMFNRFKNFKKRSIVLKWFMSSEWM